MLQVVPVPMDIVEELKETFLGCALSQDIELAEIPKHSDLKQVTYLLHTKNCFMLVNFQISKKNMVI